MYLCTVLSVGECRLFYLFYLHFYLHLKSVEVLDPHYCIILSNQFLAFFSKELKVDLCIKSM